MNNEKLFDIIGDIDDKYIEEAKEKKFPLKKVIFSVSGIAAVLCLVLLSPLGMNLMGRSHESSLPPLPNHLLVATDDNFETGVALDTDSVSDKIYYYEPPVTELDILYPRPDDKNVTESPRPVPEDDTESVVTQVSPPLVTVPAVDTGAERPADVTEKVTAELAVPDTNSVDTAVDTPVSTQVTVWYVNGGKIMSASVSAEFDPENVFAAWKDKNGIGPEVELISVKVTDNAKTETVEFMGELIVQHFAATEWYMTVTVSAELENYFGDGDKELLCESLQKTMIGFADRRNLASYQLVLE